MLKQFKTIKKTFSISPKVLDNKCCYLFLSHSDELQILKKKKLEFSLNAALTEVMPLFKTTSEQQPPVNNDRLESRQAKAIGRDRFFE